MKNEDSITESYEKVPGPGAEKPGGSDRCG